MTYQEIATNKVYEGLNDVQFKIKNVPGMEIIAGSLELDGILQVKKGANILEHDDDVFWDGLIGAHNLIFQCSEKINGRILGNNFNYPRYVKMTRNARMESTNAGSQSSTVRELCSPTDAMSTQLLVGSAGSSPFSIKPYFSVNRSSRNMTYSDCQTIEIDIRLNDKSIFYGETALVSTLSVSISNLKLRYRTQPMQKYSEPVIYPIVDYKTYTITSDKSTNDIITPIPTKWIMSSFNVKQAPGAANLDPVLRLYNPSATRIKYLYNDQNNVGVAFEMLSQEEMLMQYLLAIGDREDNNIDPQTVSGDDSSFCVASSVGILPPKTKITYQYDTNSGSIGTPYEVYTYFLGEVAM